MRPGLAVGLCLALGLAARADDLRCPHFVAGSRGLPTQGEWRTHPALGDVNGDGHLDIAAHPRKRPGPRVWHGDGKGGWTEAARGLAIPDAGCGVGVDLADVNGDGHLDLGVADHCKGLYVFLGDGKGSWRLAPQVNPTDRRGFEDLVFADLARDGRPDLVGVSAFRGGFAVLGGDGQGSFAMRETGLPGTGYAKRIVVGDVNRDGRLDVAATYSGGVDSEDSDALHRNIVWLSDAAGRYSPGSQGLPSDGQFRGVALGDVNGDGFLDLALSATYLPGRPPLLVFLGDGKGRWTPSLGGLPPAPPDPAAFRGSNGIELADLDGDGHSDLVAAGYDGAGLEVFLGDGKGGWRACTDTGLPARGGPLRGWGVAVADLDHNARLDIVAATGRNNQGRIEVWLQR